MTDSGFDCATSRAPVGSWRTGDHQSMSVVGYYEVGCRRVNDNWRLVRRVTSQMNRLDRNDGAYPWCSPWSRS